MDLDKHLAETPHPLWQGPTIPPRAYFDGVLAEPEIPIAEDDPFLNRLHNLEEEEVAVHHVGGKASARDAIRPTEVEAGHVAIVRTEDGNWYVAKVVDTDATTLNLADFPDMSVNEVLDDYVKIWEYGNSSNDLLHRHLPAFYNEVTEQSLFKKGGPERGFKPIYRWVNINTFLDWGEQDSILTSNNVVNVKIKKTISQNPNVDWTFNAIENRKTFTQREKERLEQGSRKRPRSDSSDEVMS